MPNPGHAISDLGPCRWLFPKDADWLRGTTLDNPEHIDILFPNKGEEMLHEWLSVRKIEVILRAKCEAGPRLVFHLSQRTFHPQLWSRTRFGDPSPVAFVESPENEVISERLLKKQQLRCRQCGREL